MLESPSWLHACMFTECHVFCLFQCGSRANFGIEGDDRELVEVKLGLTPHPILNSMMAINLFLTAKPGTKAGGQLH